MVNHGELVRLTNTTRRTVGDGMPNRARQIIPFPNAPSKRQQPKTNKRRWPVILLCLCLSAYFLCVGVQWVRQEMRMRALVTRCEELLRRQQQLQADNQLLQEQIQRLLNDPAYLERLAREMGMVKPGDTIYMSTDPKSELIP